MKKIYVTLASLMVVSVSNAQLKSASLPQAQGAYTPEQAEKSVQVAPIYNFDKAAGDLIYGTSFNGSLTGWTGTGTNGAVWQFDLDGPNGQYSNAAAQKIQSTTNANGFAIFDADAANPGAGPYPDMVGNLESPVIDMTGISAAIISFEHTYRTCCANGFAPMVQVSTDDFATSTSFNVAPLGASANTIVTTRLVRLDISTFLASASNLSNFKMRFRFDGTGGTSHYYWQVDDVSLTESYNNDLVLDNKNRFFGALGLDYYFLPLNQQSPATFTANVSNVGQMMQSNVQLNVNIDNGGGMVSSPPTTIAVGAEDSLITTTFTPSAMAPLVYTTNFSVTQASADDFNADNLSTDVLNITQYRWGVDNGVAAGSLSNFSSNTGNAFKIGNVMEVLADDIIYEMTIVLAATATNVGQEFFGEIFRYDAGVDDYISVGATAPMVITSTNNGTAVTMPITPIPVTAGDELLVLAGHYGGGAVADVVFRSAQPALENSVVGYDASDALFGLLNPRVPMVRVNMNPTLSISENQNAEMLATVSPNPTAGKATLNYVLNTNSDVEITIYDVAGKVVKSNALTSQKAGSHNFSIDLSSYNDGVYYVKLTSNEGQITRKVVKK